MPAQAMLAQARQEGGIRRVGRFATIRHGRTPSRQPRKRPFRKILWQPGRRRMRGVRPARTGAARPTRQPRRQHAAVAGMAVQVCGVRFPRRVVVAVRQARRGRRLGKEIWSGFLMQLTTRPSPTKSIYRQHVKSLVEAVRLPSKVSKNNLNSLGVGHSGWYAITKMVRYSESQGGNDARTSTRLEVTC
jgi:hypothetical protein